MVDDNCLMVNDDCLVVDDNCLMVNDDCLVVDDDCLMVNDDCLVVDVHFLTSIHNIRQKTPAFCLFSNL